jgi:hypothetical protein
MEEEPVERQIEQFRRRSRSIERPIDADVLIDEYIHSTFDFCIPPPAC